jgi:NADPH:quinone reductase-like Zn-dependent oxidoreductase
VLRVIDVHTSTELPKRQVQLGAFAEYVSAPWAKVVPLPAAVPLRTAAAALLQGLTALTFITEAYDVKKGDTILVHTVAGGLGLLFSQLISARGATVIGTTSSDEKAELARANGAKHVILYRHEDTVKRVLELTGGKGVDGVFDGVGKDTCVGRGAGSSAAHSVAGSRPTLRCSNARARLCLSGTLRERCRPSHH